MSSSGLNRKIPVIRIKNEMKKFKGGGPAGLWFRRGIATPPEHKII